MGKQQRESLDLSSGNGVADDLYTYLGRAPLWRRGLWWVAADYISCSPPRSVGPVGRGQAARTASRPLPPVVVQLAAAVAAAAAAAVAAAVDARAAEAAAGACVLLLLVGNAPPVHRAPKCLC